MKLYTYFRSSASYRLRIALNLKGLAAEEHYIHLRKKDQSSDAFLAVNPQGLVPALVDEGHVLTQSLAIIEYLEETHPEPSFLPADPAGRARVRALAQVVACDIHPLNNLRVLQYLTGPLGLGEAERDAWVRQWVDTGFAAMERLAGASPDTGACLHGDRPGLADICLVPQVYNAERFGIDVSRYPTLKRIHDHCLTLEAFAKAAPEAQPDCDV